MSTTEAEYGHLVSPAKPKVGPLTIPQFAYTLLALIVVSLTIIVSVKVAFMLALALGLPLGVVMLSNFLNVDLVGNIIASTRLARSARRKENLLIQGPLTEEPDVFSLPAAMHKSSILPCQDELGQEVALITHETGEVAVAFRCDPSDITVQDMHDIDVAAAWWGQWLGRLSSMSDCVGAQAVIESAPDPGHLLTESQLSQIDPKSPAITQRALRESLQINAVGAGMSTWVTVTFCPKKAGAVVGGKKMQPKEFQQSILTRIPGLCDALRPTGAGSSVRPAGSDELCRLLRHSFDPESVSFKHSDHESLDWDSIGPVAARETKDALEHDGWISRSFMMSTPPRGEFGTLILQPLLSPHTSIPRKRVALLFRPVPAEESAILADKRVRAVSSSAETRQAGVSAEHERAITAARHNARAERKGSSFVRVGALVTITAETPHDLEQASAALVSQIGGKFTVRKSWQSQSSHFLGTLPLGIVNQNRKFWIS